MKETEPRADYHNESSLVFVKAKPKRTQQRQAKPPKKSDKRTRATEERESEEQGTRKRLVRFSDSSKIRAANPGKKGQQKENEARNPQMHS